jgi:hypothetical protein
VICHDWNSVFLNSLAKETLKLALNSGYGKCALKPNTEEIVYVKESEWEVCVSCQVCETCGWAVPPYFL